MNNTFLAELQCLLHEIHEQDIFTCAEFPDGAVATSFGHDFARLTANGLDIWFAGPRRHELLSGGYGRRPSDCNNSPTKDGFVLFTRFRSLDKRELNRYFLEALFLPTNDTGPAKHP